MNALFYFYCWLYRVFKWISNDSWKDTRPQAFINLLLILIIFIIVNIISGFVRFNIKIYQGVIVCSILYLGSYYLFEYNGKWTKYLLRFDKMDKDKKRKYDLICLLILLGVFVLFIASFSLR